MPYTEKHSAHLRHSRHSIPQQIYMVTTVTRGRTPLFKTMTSARRTINCLAHMDALGASETLCFVLMPDHLHWLFSLTGKYSLSSTVGQFKQNSARSLGGPIWQKGFYDHAVRQHEDIRALARYIIANPLRAELVERVADYPYWDAMWISDRTIL